MENDLKQGYPEPQYSFPTKRYCQFLRLQPEAKKLEEYKFWHKKENIWKEIPEGIRKAGILNMEIYLAEENLAFMIVETPVDFNWDEAFGKMATYERQQEWEAFVAKYQLGKGERSEEKWQLMEQIFSLVESL